MPEYTRLVVPSLGHLSSRCRTNNNGWKNAAALIVIFLTLCMISLLINQSLVTGIQSVPFFNVGRSIQSWSSTDPDASNIIESLDIETVLHAQRAEVIKELSGSKLSGGIYKGENMKLKDLIPELGGTPFRSIIATTWRSGSTFLGEVLEAIPGTFYHYEPLLQHGIMQIRGPPLSHNALHTIRQLLSCNYTDLSEYLNYGKNHTYLFTHNSRLWSRCLENPHLCWRPKFLNKICSLFPFQSMKIVRLRLSLMEDLLEDAKLGVKVLFVVRDPRGTMQSRKHRDWCPTSSDCWDPSVLCSDLISDYSAAIKLKNRFPDTFRAVRYEDISLEPEKGVKDLLNFFGFKFHPAVKEFLDAHTSINAGGVSSTYRDSKSAPLHWRHDLRFSEVQAIQNKCSNALEYWGYQKAFNGTHQKLFNPISNNFKLK